MRTKDEVIKNAERNKRIRNMALMVGGTGWHVTEFLAFVDSDLEKYDGKRIESPIPEILHHETEVLRKIAKLYEEEGGWKVSTWDGQNGYCLTFE